MNQFETAIHWRQYSIGIVLALFIAIFSLVQFQLLRVTLSTGLGCVVLALSLSWDIYLMRLNHRGSDPGRQGEIADGLLITGLILVFLGAFF